MADKDVQRNVRSTSEEGIKTPAQKHENLSSHDVVSFGENTKGEVEDKKQEALLKKFREREELWRQHNVEEREPEKKEEE